jgi:hypothetical protein
VPNLAAIDYFITDGEGIGDYRLVDRGVVPADQLEAHMLRIGNDGTFFDDDPFGDADEKQAERNARDDLCDTCKPLDHDSCSLDGRCTCCQTTIHQMEDE